MYTHIAYVNRMDENSKYSTHIIGVFGEKHQAIHSLFLYLCDNRLIFNLKEENYSQELAYEKYASEILDSGTEAQSLLQECIIMYGSEGYGIDWTYNIETHPLNSKFSFMYEQVPFFVLDVNNHASG